MIEKTEALEIKERKISLHGQHHKLSDVLEQVNILEHNDAEVMPLTSFQRKLEQSNLYPFKPVSIGTLQMNLGKMCNQTCKHCHVDAGPDRTEIMTRETMQLCLAVLQNTPSIKTIDLTGGAPEMNPDFRWFVEEIKKLERHVIVRCNLTIIMANKKYADLPEFYKRH
ncbi:MAG: radical SAM protein, partial [Ferruginibacter sp.]